MMELNTLISLKDKIEKLAYHCALIGLDKDLGFHVLLDIQSELEAILQKDLMGAGIISSCRA